MRRNSCILSRVHLGYVTSEDLAVLEQRKISLCSDTLSGRMKEVVQTLNTLPNDTYLPGTCVLN